MTELAMLKADTKPPLKKKPGPTAMAPRTYLTLSADLARLETRLTKLRAEVTATEETLAATKKALASELARVK